jgi:hypothetical protein
MKGKRVNRLHTDRSAETDTTCWPPGLAGYKQRLLSFWQPQENLVLFTFKIQNWMLLLLLLLIYIRLFPHFH